MLTAAVKSYLTSYFVGVLQSFSVIGSTFVSFYPKANHIVDELLSACTGKHKVW